MNETKTKKLSHEILGLLGAATATAIFFFGFLNQMATSIALNYLEEQGRIFTEMEMHTLNLGVRSLSLTAAVFLFIVLFLFLLGQKLEYLREIIQGIDALRTERMLYEIPLEGNNELTELARSINYLAESERKLKEKEKELQEERETFIRNISHDIRTPLTTILSYTEWMADKNSPAPEEINSYIDLVQRKSRQIKGLTDNLFQQSTRRPEKIENGKLLMTQLACEWEEMLEDTFSCEISLDQCPEFSGEYDIEEWRRVFDNLASNVKKYADREAPVRLLAFSEENVLMIQQENRCRATKEPVESNKIGLESIRRIIGNYGGTVDVETSSEFFRITLQIPL